MDPIGRGAVAGLGEAGRIGGGGRAVEVGRGSGATVARPHVAWEGRRLMGMLKYYCSYCIYFFQM